MIRWLAALVLVLVFAGSARAAQPEAWYPVESPTTEYLSAIRFSPDGTGWAVGAASTVLRYDGQAWHRIPGPDESEALSALAPLGPDEVWVAQLGSHRLHHYQAGRWSVVQLEREFKCQALDFLHPGLGYAAGLFGMLYRYDGRSFERVQTPVLVSDRESHLDGVVILAQDDVWVGGGTGFVLHFDGRTWERQRPRRTGEGGRLRRFGDTVALVDAPVLVRRAEGWQPLASVSVHALAAYGTSVWGIGWPLPSLLRVAPGEVEKAPLRHTVTDVAEGLDGLWAVGERGLILKLEHRWLPTFVDRTFEAGVGVQAESAKAALADLDGTGALDLVLAAPFGSNSFLHAETRGAFRPQPLVTPTLAALPDASALAAVDVDGDGLADLLLRPPGQPGARPLYLLRNLGASRFWDAGPATPELAPNDASPGGDLQVADLDGDGDLDVYETRFCHYPACFAMPKVLWVNDGLGRLSPRDLAHHDGGASLAYSVSALVADLDGDGRTDIMSLNQWGEGNTFYRQAEDGALVDATLGSGLSGAIQESIAAAAGDVNGDGALDVLVLVRLGGGYGPSRLYLNDGHGHFHDATSEALLDRVFAGASRAEFADIDLDGDVDLVLAGAAPREPTSNDLRQALVRLLLNDGLGHFTDVTTKTGVGLPASDIVVEDFDGDGDLDLYLVRQGESNRLLINEPPAGGWLLVRPLSPPPNRSALGARVSVYGQGGALLGVRETNWRHPAAHLGLGKADVVTVEVRFPSGLVVRREGVKAGQVLEVAEVSRPERWLRGAAFFVRHRWAWADKRREGYGLLLALGWVLGLARIGPRLGARRWVRRWSVVLWILGIYGVLAVACMPLVPVSWLAKVLPLAATGGLGFLVFGADRAWTRRAEARFVGPYELLGVLGQGGMGIVYRARDTTHPGRPIVALKVLRPERAGDPRSLRRFVQEAELGGRLCHPGIVSVLASGECRVLEGRVWRSTAYLAMECVEGSSLSTLLAGERLPLTRTVEIVRDAATALAAAHAAGVLHRDIKPDNLLLSRAGVVKLVDFGIAAATAPERSEAGLLVGTLGYLPPERAAGRPEDARGDLYALGAVLYEAVCGRRLFDEAKDTSSRIAAVASEEPIAPSVLRRELPPRLDVLILSLLAKDPARRPGSAQQVVEALDAVLRELGGQTEEAPPQGAPALAPPRTDGAQGQETLELPPVEENEVEDRPGAGGALERETLELPRSEPPPAGRRED